MAGRTRVYDSVEELDAAIERYFADKRTSRGKVTMSGLALSLGFADRQSLYDYEKNEQFSCSIKRALLQIENAYETALYGQAVTGPIFALKNMGWKDKSEIDHRTPEGITVTYKQQECNKPLPDDD